HPAGQGSFAVQPSLCKPWERVFRFVPTPSTLTASVCLDATWTADCGMLASSPLSRAMLRHAKTKSTRAAEAATGGHVGSGAQFPESGGHEHAARAVCGFARGAHGGP